MKDSTIEMFLGENRAIELEFTDASFASVPLSGAFYEIYDSNSNKIVEESSAVILDINKVSCIISKDILVKPGIYFIIWRIIAFSQEFKHRTQVYIKDFI